MAYNYTAGNMGIPPELIKWVRNILTDEFHQLAFQVERMEMLKQELAASEARIAQMEANVLKNTQVAYEQVKLAEELNLATMNAINRIMSAHSNQP